jgi:hypothetical protein
MSSSGIFPVQNFYETIFGSVLRHVKGAGESNETEMRFDPDINLRMGGFNLTNGTWWSTSEGKKQLEAELATRLWGVNITSGV